ncbi:MAG TPA: hypothetical protein VNK23_13835 [Candidatus Dormibacteraeota bacterium]|nr:hypothetical protein [Candidatus Dormibacteraeota bacterium]
MYRQVCLRRILPLCLSLAALSIAIPSRASAQFGGYPPPARPANPRQIAPQDFTGYWVSLVTEDWRWRMLTPDKGDYSSVPLNSVGKALADTWDPAKDTAAGEQCKSYGAPALMRIPTRLHIAWADDHTLRIDTDAGTQTRLLHFDSAAPADFTPSWQGYSVASWEGLKQGGMFRLPTVAGGGAQQTRAPEGYLKVVTTHLRPGYLRKNGVPYSANTVLEEYYDGFTEPNGDSYLVVTTIVTDPQYLSQPFITSSHFKKQTDASGWNPTPCEAR